MISVISRQDVVDSARRALRIPPGKQVDDAYWIATLRRLAGCHCPCSPRTLISYAIDSHRHLIDVDDSLKDKIEEIIDSLVVTGDLLELNDVTTFDETIKATWLFAAPPTFVVHPSGTAFLCGLTNDDPLPLPSELFDRVKSRGTVRTIDPLETEELTSTLRELGFRQLSLETWLKSPKKETAVAHVASANAKLPIGAPIGDTTDMRLFDWTTDKRRYRDRWCPPSKQSGEFVVRRPQAYGADLWGYGRFRLGQLEALLDLPLPGSRLRGCDAAWRLQLAKFASEGRAQTYRTAISDGLTKFDFFFPLPLWAQRRLRTVGEELQPDSCLFSYSVDMKVSDAEAAFLHDYLFLENDSSGTRRA